MINSNNFDLVKFRLAQYFEPDLLQVIKENGTVTTIPANTKILREGQYIKVVPYVLEGIIKVLRKFNDREMLLYYIKPNESCIMSFSASIYHYPSSVYAITEVESKVLLLPSRYLESWVNQFRGLSMLFFKQYHAKYTELIERIDQLIHLRMDERILNFLKQRLLVKGTKTIKITHKQIAVEMGSAREVVSRIIKKLERDGILVQHPDGIEVLNYNRE